MKLYIISKNLVHGQLDGLLIWRLLHQLSLAFCNLSRHVIVDLLWHRIHEKTALRVCSPKSSESDGCSPPFFAAYKIKFRSNSVNKIIIKEKILKYNIYLPFADKRLSGIFGLKCEPLTNVDAHHSSNE